MRSYENIGRVTKNLVVSQKTNTLNLGPRGLKLNQHGLIGLESMMIQFQTKSAIFKNLSRLGDFYALNHFVCHRYI